VATVVWEHGAGLVAAAVSSRGIERGVHEIGAKGGSGARLGTDEQGLRVTWTDEDGRLRTARLAGDRLLPALTIAESGATSPAIASAFGDHGLLVYETVRADGAAGVTARALNPTDLGEVGCGWR
jgi:hypothetical protein